MEANELELHNLISSKDDLALAKLYDKYGPVVASYLRRWYLQTAKKDDALILEAVNEAFWGYYKNPFTYDASKSTLQRFLEIASERDLLNILDREKKHTGKKNMPENVELEEIFWNDIKRNTKTTDEQIIEIETMELVDKELKSHFPNETDLLLAKMILQGIRPTSEFSEILQISALSVEQQKIEVKKAKDRIIKVIKRNQVVSKLKILLQ